MLTGSATALSQRCDTSSCSPGSSRFVWGTQLFCLDSPTRLVSSILSGPSHRLPSLHVSLSWTPRRLPREPHKSVSSARTLLWWSPTSFLVVFPTFPCVGRWVCLGPYYRQDRSDLLKYKGHVIQLTNILRTESLPPVNRDLPCDETKEDV